MKNPDIKLIGLDLDGTTLTTDKVLTEHTKNVLEECLARGIVVLPATGRVACGIPDYLKEIKGVRYILTSNGGAVIDLKDGSIIYENGIPWERALEVFDILETYDTFYDAYVQGMGWCEKRFMDDFPSYNSGKHIENLVRSTRTVIDDLRVEVTRMKSPVEKINMFFKNPEDKDLVMKELAAIEDLYVTSSLWNNLEINYYSCNKGDALLNLGKLLDIPAESIMACGDGNNDLKMVEMAGLGVAMENAVDEVKKVANFVTKTNDEEGVAYAIEKFCLRNEG